MARNNNRSKAKSVCIQDVSFRMVEPLFFSALSPVSKTNNWHIADTQYILVERRENWTVSFLDTRRHFLLNLCA